MDRVELFSLGESMGKVNLDNKNILVTGAAGFIGSNLIKRIYREVPLASIIGIDNHSYYRFQLY